MGETQTQAMDDELQNFASKPVVLLELKTATGKTLEFDLGVGRFVIGRQQNLCDIHVHGVMELSRKHATLEIRQPPPAITESNTPQCWVYVKDLGSNNGTYINGQLIGNEYAYPVMDHDSLRFANVDARLFRKPEPNVAASGTHPSIDFSRTIEMDPQSLPPSPPPATNQSNPTKNIQTNSSNQKKRATPDTISEEDGFLANPKRAKHDSAAPTKPNPINPITATTKKPITTATTTTTKTDTNVAKQDVDQNTKENSADGIDSLNGFPTLPGSHENDSSNKVDHDMEVFHEQSDNNDADISSKRSQNNQNPSSNSVKNASAPPPPQIVTTKASSSFPDSETEDDSSGVEDTFANKNQPPSLASDDTRSNSSSKNEKTHNQSTLNNSFAVQQEAARDIVDQAVAHNTTVTSDTTVDEDDHETSNHNDYTSGSGQHLKPPTKSTIAQKNSAAAGGRQSPTTMASPKPTPAAQPSSPKPKPTPAAQPSSPKPKPTPAAQPPSPKPKPAASPKLKPAALPKLTATTVNKSPTSPSNSANDPQDNHDNDDDDQSAHSSHKNNIPTEAELSKMTVKTLGEKLREMGLPASGRKAELIARILSALSSPNEAHTTTNKPKRAKAAKPESQGSHQSTKRLSHESNADSNDLGDSVPQKRSRTPQPSPASQQSEQTTSPQNVRILFTGGTPDKKDKVLNSLLKDIVVDRVEDCTVLVSDKVRKTCKFLMALCTHKPIVSHDWLDACKRARAIVDYSPYSLEDPEFELENGIPFSRVIENSKSLSFAGWKFCFALEDRSITDLRSIVGALGAQVIGMNEARLLFEADPTSVVFVSDSTLWSQKEFARKWKPFKDLRCTVIAKDFITSTILGSTKDMKKYRISIV